MTFLDTASGLDLFSRVPLKEESRMLRYVRDVRWRLLVLSVGLGAWLFGAGAVWAQGKKAQPGPNKGLFGGLLQAGGAIQQGGLGQTVSALTHQGVHGQQLAQLIHQMHGAGGKGGPGGGALAGGKPGGGGPG